MPTFVILGGMGVNSCGVTIYINVPYAYEVVLDFLKKGFTAQQYAHCTHIPYILLFYCFLYKLSQ